MKHISWLGVGFLTPALLIVGFLFFAPVVMTAVFSFTNMSTATGISGGDYLLSPNNLDEMQAHGVSQKTLDALADTTYQVDDHGLLLLAQEFGTEIANELKERHNNDIFKNRGELERALKDMKHRIRSPRDRKKAADLFGTSILNQRFTSKVDFITAVIQTGAVQADIPAVTSVAYTGWQWTTNNFKRLFSLPATWRYALNTLAYVTLTLVFNIGFGLFLAISTFYMPEGFANTFRTIWFLPRILPPVLYVLMWKWFTWDTGFLSTILAPLGIPAQNWMMQTSTHAWVTIILINGSVGASLGMILFSSAIRSIPASMLHASEVDGASRFQQIRHIILPQLRWPILFLTSYETLSLLASFEHILLTTDGGPGKSTEVWALAAFHTALRNYSGNLQYGYGAAFALILVAIGIAASLVYMRLFNFRDLVSKPRIER
ncbi:MULTISPECIES: carbohydrate ABC transporter permease [Pseudomonadota]|uniref:ABC transporter permease n=2 Tax=Thalassospira TaxID=168934 RepID=A0A1Y2LE06_9PROT|nr:sugar ABC transporter permease [Thalassospira alkalitolerans]OSQ49228.1 ABC transporter permease [Thalassospira alkalitolerans]